MQITEFVKITTKRRGWLTDFNVRHNYTSPARVDELVRDLAYHAGSLHTLARQTKETLRTIFDVHTISEWLEQKLLPLFQQLDRIQTDAVNLKKRKYWPHRPLPTFDQWNYYGIQLDDLKVTNTFSFIQPSRRHSFHIVFIISLISPGFESHWFVYEFRLGAFAIS